MKTVWVQILKWKLYNNVRKGTKSTSWYRMQNDFVEHPLFFDLENDQRLVWPYLLGKASAKMKGVIEISVAHCAAMVKSSPDAVRKTLEYFAEKKLIKLLDRPEDALSDDQIDAEMGLDERDEEQMEEMAEDLAQRACDAFEANTQQTRGGSAADTQQTRSDIATDPQATRRATERNGTERNEESTPYSPAVAGRVRSKPSRPRISRTQADCAFRELVVVGNRDRSEAGWQSLSPLAQDIVRWRYVDVKSFFARYVTAAQKGQIDAFEASLQKAARAYARQANTNARAADERATAPPPEPRFEPDADYHEQPGENP